MSKWKEKWHRVPKGARIVGMVLVGLATAAVFGLVFGIFVRELWNWLMPELFGLKTITYWQAFGIVILGHLIFGRGGGGGHENGGHKSGAKSKKFVRRGHVILDEQEDMKQDWRHWQYYDAWWKSEGKEAFYAYTDRKETENGGEGEV